MRTMEDLRRRIANVNDVQSIVSTMKTLAAVQMRQYESAANAMTDYLRTVELGFHVLQRIEPVSAPTLKSGTHAAIVFGSDQGLCGKFNEVVAEHTLSQLHETPARLVVVGSRAAALLENALAESKHVNIERTLRTPITVSDITGVLEDLMPVVNDWQLDDVSRIDVHFNTRVSASSYTPETFCLFPISPHFLERCRTRPWRSRRLPIHTMDRNALLAVVVRQYLFVGLYRACAESRASENASRIAAMQAASKNIDRRLQELQTQFNESRQAAITEEILDIAAGVEALRSQ